MADEVNSYFEHNILIQVIQIIIILILNFKQIKPFKGQIYNDFKSIHSSFKLFEDPLFPANNKSLYTKTMGLTGVRWMRPKVYFVSFFK